MIKYLFLSMRPHQWSKGIFILMPLVFGQKLFDYEALTRTLGMFFIFNFIAGAMYLINDVIDLEEDRSHPEKCKRPLASGKLSVNVVVPFVAAVMMAGLVAAFRMDIRAGILMVGYVILNLTYMKILKHAVIIDVFCLGAFFYIRILAGGIASYVVLSNWIIMCTCLLALFLGFNKRRYDLEFSKNDRRVFKKYDPYFVDRMISIVASSIVIAYSLYVMDPATIEGFGTPHLIYSVPFVYYGIFRYIYLIDTKWFGGDPAKVLLGDYKIQLTMVLWLLVCVGVIYF